MHRPATPALSPALVEDGSLAYLTLERAMGEEDSEPRFRLGAVGYGPSAAGLAERICEQIRAWSSDRSAEPTVAAYPAGTPDSRLASGTVIDKRSCRLVVSY